METSEGDLSNSEVPPPDYIPLGPNPKELVRGGITSVPPISIVSFQVNGEEEGEESWSSQEEEDINDDQNREGARSGAASPREGRKSSRKAPLSHRSKSQDPKDSRHAQIRLGTTTSTDQKPEKEPGPPPPSYIPAPPSRKQKRQSQHGFTSRVASEPVEGPPPPSYIPPLPMLQDSAALSIAIPLPLPTLESQSELMSEDDRISIGSCAFGVTYLISQLSTLMEVVDSIVKAWFRPLDEGCYIQKSIVDAQLENLAEFNKSVLSINVIKLLKEKSFLETPISHEEALHQVIQQLQQQLLQQPSQPQLQPQPQPGPSPLPIKQLQQPLGKIHKDLPMLWSLISGINDFDLDLKIRLKNQFSSCQHYKKSAMEQVAFLQSNNPSLYWTAPQLLESGLHSLESTASELKSLSKHFEKKQQQLTQAATKDIEKSFIHLGQIKVFIEKEQPYLENLTDLAESISISARHKFNLLVPGRRFLKSAILNHYTNTSGKLKKGNQTRVFLFNDLLLFTQPKTKETKRLSTGQKSSSLFRMPGSPRSLRETYKMVHYIYLDELIVVDKAYGSENLVEFAGCGKKMIVAVDELRMKTEWLKSVQTQAKTWKSQVLDKKDKKQPSSDIEAGQETDLKDYKEKKNLTDSKKAMGDKTINVIPDPDVKDIKKGETKKNSTTDPDIKDFERKRRGGDQIDVRREKFDNHHNSNDTLKKVKSASDLDSTKDIKRALSSSSEKKEKQVIEDVKEFKKDGSTTKRNLVEKI